MRDTLRRRRLVLAGVALALAQLAFRWWWARDGYFWQDDFRYLAQTKDGLTAAALLQDYNGHLMPGSFLLSWVVAQLDSSFGVALALQLGLELIASLLLVWVVHLLVPGRLLGLPAMAAAMFTSLTLVGVSWFAYGIQLWPLQISLLASIGCYLSWRRTRGMVWGAGVLGAYVFGLFFWEKAILVVPVLLLLGLLVLDRQVPIRERARTLVGEWRLWLLVAVVTLAYVVLYLTRIDSVGSSDTGGGQVSIGTFLANALLRTLLPGLLGGPWTSAGSIYTVGATPHAVMVGLTVVLWLAIVAVSFVRLRWRALQAWAWAAAVVSLDYGLVVAFRPYAEVLARDSRYIADIIPVVALALLAAFYDTPSRADERAEALEAHPRRSTPRWSAPVAAATAGALVVSGCVSSTLLAGGLLHPYSRGYVDAVGRAVAADPSRPVLDGSVPPYLVFFGPLSELTHGMGLRPTYVDAGQNVHMYDGIGRPRPVTIKDPELDLRGPQPGCGWPVKPGQPVEILVPGNLNPWLHRVIQVGYVSQRVHQLTVTADGVRRASLPTEDVLGVLTVRMRNPPRVVRLSVSEPGATVCVSDVRIGTATPKQD